MKFSLILNLDLRIFLSKRVVNNKEGLKFLWDKY